MKRFLFAILASCAAIYGVSCSGEIGQGDVSVDPKNHENENEGNEEDNQNQVDPDLVCEAGQKKCDGYVLLECNDSTLEFEAYPCPSSHRCDEAGGVAQCIEELPEPECTDGISKCDGDILIGCENGQYVDPGTDCTLEGGYCIEEGGTASCKVPEPEKLCNEGDTKCDGDNVQICDDAEQFYTFKRCAEQSQVCVVTTDGADCSATCTEGAKRCNAGNLEVCNAEGAFDVMEVCIPDGECVSKNGESQCVEKVVYEKCTGSESKCDETGLIVKRCVNGYFQDTDCSQINKQCGKDGTDTVCVDIPCQEGSTECGAANTLSTCVGGEWQKDPCVSHNPPQICSPTGNAASTGSHDQAGCMDPPVVTDQIDTDGDGILDITEGRAQNRDSDRDGIPDYLDLDSDADTIPDSVEAGNNGVLSIPPVDSDFDGTPDYLDTDSDNNGIADSVEACISFPGTKQTCVRTSMAKGKNEAGNDLAETFQAVTKPSNFNAGDTLDNGPDYLDEDNDGDGWSDLEEITGRTLDTYPTPVTLIFSGNCKSNTKGTANKPVDCNGDTIPDYVSLDSDGDGIPDAQEGALYKTNIGTYLGRKYAVYARYNTDSDGDGITDNLEATNKNGTWTLLDSDGDGVPDMLETDSDGDSLSDADEYALEKISPCSASNPPRRKKDTDNDGYNDAAEKAVAEDSGKYTPAQMICNNGIGVKDVYDFYFELKDVGVTSKPQELKFIPQVTMLDVVFNVDTTGSMSGVISSVKSGIGTMVNTIHNYVTNSGFGVTEYRDFPINNNGSSGDLPFRLRGNVNTNTSTVSANVNNISNAGGGNDGPESGAESLYQIATGNGVSWRNSSGTLVSVSAASNTSTTWGGVGFRKDTLPVIVHVSDATSHDSTATNSTYSLTVPNTNQGPYVSCSSSTTKNCVSNPHYTKDLVPVLKNKGIRVITLNTPANSTCTSCSYNADGYGQMTAWARESDAVVPVCAFKTSDNKWNCNGVTTANRCCLGVSDTAPVTINGKSDMCVLAFRGKQSETSTVIPKAVEALVKYSTYDVKTRVQSKTQNGVNTSCFIEKIEALRYEAPTNEPEKSCNPTATVKTFATGNFGTGFTDFAPGTAKSNSTTGAKLYFNVYAKNNNCVAPSTTTQVFKATIEVYDPKTGMLFDTQDVSILIPPITEGTNG